MNLNNFLDKDINEVFQNLKHEFEVIEFIKIDRDEFIKVPEEGFFLQSHANCGIINQYRLFFQKDGDYFPSGGNYICEFKHIDNVDGFIEIYGIVKKEIPSITIPGRNPTKKGFRFEDGNRAISVFVDNFEKISSVHVERI